MTDVLEAVPEVTVYSGRFLERDEYDEFVRWNQQTSRSYENPQRTLPFGNTSLRYLKTDPEYLLRKYPWLPQDLHRFRMETGRALTEPSDPARPLEEDEKEAYAEWNGIAGDRTYGYVTLPWVPDNMRRILAGTLEDNELLDILTLDLVRFRTETDRLDKRFSYATADELKRALEADEKEAYREWNTSAGRRAYYNMTLPWDSRAIERAINNPEDMEDSFGDDVYKAFARFRRETKRLGKPKPPEPWAPPADDTAPIDVSDPRVRHLWVTAAEVSRENGWCSTYDNIAATVGVPTRKQLKKTGELKVQMRIVFRPILRVVVDNPDGKGYQRLYEKMDMDIVREQLRLAADMDDAHLREFLGGVNDYTNLE